MGSKRNPSVAVASRTTPLFMKDLDGRTFPLVGGVFSYPHIDKCRMDSGWSSVSSWAGRKCGHTASQFRHTPDYPRDVIHGWFISKRWCQRPLWERGVGSNFGDFLFRSVWKNPRHRSRMRTLSLRSVPSSSMMTCSLLAFRPPNPTTPFKCSYAKHNTREKAHSTSTAAAGVGHVAIRQHRQGAQYRQTHRRPLKLLGKLAPSW